ncbi:MAG: 2-dehydropantoate 2-reductase [Acidimicrobiia bacterium]|nr:2-dehydropantoate 2-reductase [Acidimicrobiia bacterium]
MKFVVYGAGAVGGVVGGRLAQHGHEVSLVARGAHARAMRERGLVLESAEGTARLDLEVAEHPAELSIDAATVVLVAVKSQATHAVLEALHGQVPAETPIVCLQNGVENERAALRLFPNVYGICVMCPTGHLTPGVVQAFSSPVAGILDIGRYPAGVDETANAVAGALHGATFVSVARPDIARWKSNKLLMNLGNAIDALCGAGARGGPLRRAARTEGAACLEAAGIPFVSDAEEKERRGDLLQVHRSLGEGPRPGSSSWQSLQRGTGTVEADYLNGEIVLLGRLHGVPTPVNELLQRLMDDAARAGRPPGSVTEAELLDRLELSSS